MWGAFLIGGFSGYFLGTLTFCITSATLGLIIDGRTDVDYVAMIYLCALGWGWMVLPLAISAFIGEGIVAVMLVKIHRNKSKTFYWCVASIGGAIVGTIACIIFFCFSEGTFLGMPIKQDRWLICSTIAGLSVGAFNGYWCRYFSLKPPQ